MDVGDGNVTSPLSIEFPADPAAGISGRRDSLCWSPRQQDRSGGSRQGDGAATRRVGCRGGPRRVSERVGWGIERAWEGHRDAEGTRRDACTSAPAGAPGGPDAPGTSWTSPGPSARCPKRGSTSIAPFRDPVGPLGEIPRARDDPRGQDAGGSLAARRCRSGGSVTSRWRTPSGRESGPASRDRRATSWGQGLCDRVVRTQGRAQDGQGDGGNAKGRGHPAESSDRKGRRSQLRPKATTDRGNGAGPSRDGCRHRVESGASTAKGGGPRAKAFGRDLDRYVSVALTEPIERATRGPSPPSRGGCGSNSVVECHLAKVDVEGSNPFSRSTSSRRLAEESRGSAAAAPPRDSTGDH